MVQEKLCLVLRKHDGEFRSYTGVFPNPHGQFYQQDLWTYPMKKVVIHDANHGAKSPKELKRMWKNSPKKGSYQIKPEDGILTYVTTFE